MSQRINDKIRLLSIELVAKLHEEHNTIAHCTEFENMQADILTQLERKRQQFPERFSKPIHVLADVHDNVNGEWEERLQQAKEDQIGERIVLIPYKVKGCHWIGIFLKFKANEQIERAEFIDPLKFSKFVPDKLQKQLTKIYSGVVLKSRNLKKDDDPERSAALTMDNLLKAAEDDQLPDISSNPKPNIDFTTNNPSISSEGKESEKYEELDRIEVVNGEENSSNELTNSQGSVEEVKLKTSSETPNNLKEKEEEHSVTGESLKNMQQDFSIMPSCSERSIICLLYYLSLKSIDSFTLSNYNIRVPDNIDTEIQKEFESLKERLKIEELNSTENNNKVTVASVNVKNKNWKSAMTELKKLLSPIRPLDIHELFRLVEKVNDAAALVKDKKIILFMGFTGSGKSTTIHFLSGSKMVQIDGDEYVHIAPTEIKNPDLEKIISSGEMRSETRYITPVTIKYSDVGAYSQGSVILCDSPGFGDTAGPEVDIANGIGIIRAIKECKSVKPVVLLSYTRRGDRCEGVKEVAHILAGLIPNLEEYIGAFSYIFTKYPDTHKKTIHGSLNAVNRTLTEEEKSDIGFVNALIDMLTKTEKGARTLDPLSDEPGKILDELARSAVIHHPDEVFEFSITAKSKAVVQQQIRQNQLSIMSATERSDYSLVRYRLDQLKSLNDLLHEDYIGQVYNESIRQIRKHLSNEYQNGISMFDRCLINQTILNIEDIQQYQTCISHFKLVEELRDTHLGKEVVHSSAFITHLNQQIEILCVDLREKDIDDPSVKIILDKIKLVSDFFPDVKCTHQNICQLFSEKFNSIVTSYKNSVLSNKFNESANNINKLNDARTHLHDHLDSENMQATYAKLQEYFLDYLNDCVKKLDNILTKDKLEKTDVDSLNNCVCILESASKTFTLEPHISINDIRITYENLLSQILNYIDQIIKKIDTQWKDENSFHILEQYMQQLDLIRTISIINVKTSESYWKTLEKLIGYIQESRRLVEEQLRILFRREGKIDYNKLTKCLSNLKGAQWIEKYRNGV